MSSASESVRGASRRRALAALVLASLSSACLGSACSSSSQGGLRVELISQQSVDVGQEVRASEGVVRIDEMRWISSEVELRACATLAGSVRDWLVPQAHAHGTSSPTLLAVPTVVSATAIGAAVMGELAPPAGRYCSVRYRIAAADADAVGLAGAPSMLGMSFSLRGAFGREPGQLRELELSSDLAMDVTLDIDLELSLEQPLVSLGFECDTERWLANIDLGSLTGNGNEGALLEAFRAAFRVRVE